MVSSRIKGITVEIGGDTVGLQNALKEVNKRTKDVQSELKDVERLLKFDPNNVELLAQRQELLTQAIQSSTEKLNQLRQAEAQVQAQFERGEISQEQYRGFRRELQQTEQQLAGFQQALQNMQTEQEQVGQRTRQMSALFDATGTSVQDYANVIGQRLVQAIQNGTATSRDLEYAFQRIGRQAIGSNGDIERLRTTLASVDDGNSIQNIRRDLQLLQQEAEQTEEAVEGIGVELENVAGALVAGGGIAGSVEKALEAASLDTKIDISMEVSDESKQAVKNAVREVVAVIEEEESALEGVRRQWALNKEASDETNASIVKGASAIVKAYEGIDFIELIQETNEISAALKISDEEALGLTNSLLKLGFPPEQLDIIAEYGTQLQRAGATGAEVQALFAAGVATDSWNIDILLDGIKEGRIVLSEFGDEIDKATTALIDGTGISTEQLKKWGNAVAGGGKDGSQAMIEAAKAIEGIDDATKRNLVGVKVFGTLYEEHGSNITQTLINASKATVDLKDGQESLNESIAKIDSSPAVQLQKAFGDLTIALTPLLLIIADVVGKLAEWVSNNPTLVAAIVAIGTALGVLVGAIMAIAPIVTAIVTTMGTFGATLGAVLAPVGLVIAGITALVAAGVLLYQNWETVKEFALSIWSSIGEHFGGVIEQIKGYIKTGMEFVQSTIKSILSAAVSFAKDILKSFAAFWKENGDQITAIVKGAMSLVSSLISAGLKHVQGLFEIIMPIITGVVKVAWGIISTTIKSVIDFILGTVQVFLKIFKGDWSGAFETIKDTTKKIWENIVKTFKDLDLKQIGKDIINGLIKGITSMASGVWKAVKSIGNSIKDVFTSMFDIHSPSRVFEGYGINLNEGLINGIKNSSNQLKKAVNNTYGSLSTSASRMMDINSSETNARNSSNKLSPINLSIAPAPVILDGIQIGQVDFDLIDDGMAGRLNARMMINGVRPR